MKTIAIIPALNEEVSIGSTVLKIRKYVDHTIIVDGGSRDKTTEIAKLAGADVIIHKKIIGKNGAFKAGFELASQNGRDAILCIDSYCKRHTDIVPETIDYIKNDHYDMVVLSQNGNGNKNVTGKEQNKMVAILAFYTESFNGINLDNSNFINILNQAERNNLKIKYLNLELENKTNFNQLDRHNIGVVVPAYNEELFIGDTISGIPTYVKKIYVIDDGSKDKTSEIIKNTKDSRVCYVKHEKNSGVGAAIITGYKLALEDNMNIVAVMAGDNQMDPEQLPKLIKPIIENKADYTKGNRLISKDFRKGMSNWRFFGNSVLTMITKIGSGYWHIMDPQNGYTAISRKALETIDLDSIYPYYGYCNDILIKLNTMGMKVEDVVIPARYGKERSKIRYSKYIIKVAPMIFRGFLWRLKTRYMILDFHPLIFFYMSGMILLPVGVITDFWILFQKINNNIVSPNLPIISVFITLISLQFLMFAMFFDMQADKEREMKR